jgi:uncharacterized protein (TIGR00159 family)
VIGRFVSAGSPAAALELAEGGDESDETFGHDAEAPEPPRSGRFVAMDLVRFVDLLDIAVVALLLWVMIAWFRRSRARFALLGLAALGAVYLLADQLEMQLTATLLQGFFAIFLVLVVVVFQEDLRRLFEQIAMFGLRRRAMALPETTLDTLARAIERLAATRTGALIVLPGREPLDRHLEGGIVLDAVISEPLILSIFDGSSPGHDGAILVEHDRVRRFAMHLPLSDNRSGLGPGGTRHAAALGLSERSDSLCVVVSEERGTISIAHRGELRVIAGSGALIGELRAFRQATPASPSDRRALLRRHAPEVGAAVTASALLWLALVPGGSMGQQSIVVPIRVDNLPDDFALDGIDPSEVEVTLAGRRRTLMLLDEEEVSVAVDALLAKLGRRTFELEAENVERPAGLDVTRLDPDRVRLNLRDAKEQPSQRGAEATRPPKPRG